LLLVTCKCIALSLSVNIHIGKQVANHYFIQQYLQEEYVHGGVGGTDAEKILLESGFTAIYFPQHWNFSVVAKLKRLIFLFKSFFSIKNRSVVVFLFPVYATMNRILISWLSRKKNVHTVCFIADIDGIKDGDEVLLKREIKFFRRFRNFIVHNERMRAWVNEHVSSSSQIATIEFFDFLTSPVEQLRDISCEIVFAGNLEKSSFLEQLHLLKAKSPLLHFHLYGEGKTDNVTRQANTTWHGVEKPGNLPQKLEGSFGLIWDGKSIDMPAGSHGIYMQYISHHKLSLYIVSKLPLIAPETSAAATLIRKYNIGFTVTNLYEIEDKIKKLSSAEYKQMQLNMGPLAEKISKGKCLGRAIGELLERLS
jgi:hypothetical protein